jgi:hypothetical protein
MGDADAAKKLMDKYPNLAKLFYRYSLPGSYVGRMKDELKG